MDNQIRSVDKSNIVFLIDSTASMRSCMDDLKVSLGDFIDTLADSPRRSGLSRVHDWRAKVVSYRNVELDSRWIVNNPFVRDSTELRAQLAAVQAKGCENRLNSLLEAIHCIGSMDQMERDDPDDQGKWRHRSAVRRLVYIFSDTGFHDPMRSLELRGGGIGEIAQLAMTNRIILSIYAPEMDCYNDLCVIDKSEYQSIAYDRADPNGPQKGLAAFTADRQQFVRSMRSTLADCWPRM